MRYNIFWLILLMLIPAAVFAQDINIQGGAKDAMISSAADTLNYGASKVAKVGRKSAADTLRFLYQSDVLLARIPPGATIDSVVFKLYQCSTATDTSIGSGFLYLKWLDSSFSEGTQNAAKDTVNWKRKLHGRESNVTAWPTAGGSFNSTKVDSQAFAQATDSIAFHDDSLDALVQRWVNGTQANRGFIITSSDESQNEIWVFATSDSTGRQPRWEIWYTVTSPSWSKKYLSQDSSGVTDWIPDDDMNVGYSDSSGYASNAATPTIVDTSRLALDADSLRGVAAVQFLTRTQIDSALVPKIDTTRVRAMIRDSVVNSATIISKTDTAGVRAIVRDSLDAFRAAIRTEMSDTVQTARVTVEESDGNPSGQVQVIRFSGLTVTISGDTATMSGAGSVGNADSLGAKPASYYAAKAPGIITLHPAFPLRSYKILSADTTVSAVAGLSGDSIVHSFTGTAEAIDSLRMTVLIPIPGDFSAFNTDSALTIRWWGSGNSTDSSYLELDAYLYPLTAELDSSKLASNKAWNTILVKSAALATNTWKAGDVLRLNFTLGVKDNHDVLIERIVIKYTRQ